jgi:acetolactate synthase-1/2/3 large subunit
MASTRRDRDGERARRHRLVDYVVAYLADMGIDYIFGVDGANIEDLYDAAHFHEAVTAVLAKHEFSAATMADGYSRTGTRIGVVAATSGGGCLNLVPGLGESLASRVPVLALVGQPPTNLDGRGSFQDTSGQNGSLDAHTLFSAVSVYCRRVAQPSDIFEALPAAIAHARRGGPAVLLLPKDVQQSLVGTNGYHRADLGPSTSTGDTRVLARELRRARGPVTIIAGEQVARDDARQELEQLRATLRAQVATVPDAKDVNGLPGLGASSALGVTGVMGHPSVVDVVADSAVCLLIGTRLAVTARAGLDDALTKPRTISIGSAPPYFPCTHIHTDDLRDSLAQLNATLSGSGKPSGVRVPEATTLTQLSPPIHDGPGVRYREAMAVLDRELPSDVDIAVDAGNNGAAAIHYLPARRGGRFVVALGMGGMGYSFGAGIGIALGRRQRTVVIAGDGSFFMHGMEIHTAIQHRLPVIFVLLNNHAHAMCVIREQLFYDDRYSYNRFRPSHLGAGLAAMFPGLMSVDVDDIDELPRAVRTALNTDGPSVISVECSADEIPPFAPFLVNHNGKTTSSDHDTKENNANVATRA